MRVIIRKWYGRFGNNFSQLRNALQVALYYNHQSVIFPPHKFLKCKCIVINKENKNTKVLHDEKDFFSRGEIKNINSELFFENCERTIELIRENFTLDLDKIKVLGDDELVIHMRSGDIFCDNPHPVYVLPPFSYYKNIISKKFKTIHLVCEDMNNPMIKKLRDIYPEIKCKQRNLIEDMKIILGSKNVVESFGTFTPVLIMISKHVKQVYKPSYQGYLLHKEGVTVNNTDLDEYRKKMNPWDNSKEKRKYMLEN